MLLHEDLKFNSQLLNVYANESTPQTAFLNKVWGVALLFERIFTSKKILTIRHDGYIGTRNIRNSSWGIVHALIIQVNSDRSSLAYCQEHAVSAFILTVCKCAITCGDSFSQGKTLNDAYHQ